MFFIFIFSSFILLSLIYSRAIAAFLKFVRSTVYVNMARVEPAIFSRAVTDPALLSKGSLVKFKALDRFPIGLMALSVRECFLREPGPFGSSGNQSLLVYKITGHPFPQEYRRDVSIWCSLLGFEANNDIVGPIGPNGVTFQTKTPSRTAAGQGM